MEKKTLSPVDLEAQAAFELPERREMALVAVNLLNGSTIFVPIGVAANICGVQANVLAQQLVQTGSASCTARGQ